MLFPLALFMQGGSNFLGFAPIKVKNFEKIQKGLDNKILMLFCAYTLYDIISRVQPIENLVKKIFDLLFSN